MQKNIYLFELVSRMGHLLYDPYLIRNLYGEEENWTLAIPPGATPANPAAFAIIRRYFKIVPLPEFWQLKELVQSSGRKSVETGQLRVWSSFSDQAEFEYYRRWLSGEITRRCYELTDKEIAMGQRIEESLGIPSGAPVVTIHNREAGYLPHLAYHAFRDFPAEDFLPAVDYLTERGIHVVRIGDPSMKSMPKRPLLHDLVKEELPPLAQIYLVLRSLFMICNTSGPVNIPIVFGAPPRLMVNFTNRPSYAHPLDRTLPKLFFSKRLGRPLSIEEMLYPGVLSYRAEDYARLGLDVINNDPSDILNGVQEMLYALGGHVHDYENDMLHQAYLAACRRSAHYRSLLGELEEYYLIPHTVCHTFLHKHPEYIRPWTELSGVMA